MDSIPTYAFVAAGAALLLGALMGFLFGKLRAARQVQELEVELEGARVRLEAVQRNQSERFALLEQWEARLRETFDSLAGETLRANSELFLRMAREALGRDQALAQKADVEGYNDVAAVFRSTAEGETGHAHGHLEFLESVGDPATGLPIGSTEKNLAAAVAGETHEYTDMYPGMARTAREEGFDEIADWFETLAKAERSHAGRFQRALDELKKA